MRTMRSLGPSHSRNMPLPPESLTPVNGHGNRKGKDKEEVKDREKKPASKGPKPFDQVEREEMENLHE